MTEPPEVVDPDEPEEAGEPPAAEAKRHSFWKELPFLVVIALVLAVLIKTFLVQAFYIPSASMENTLQGGNPTNAPGTSPGHPFDRVLVNKLVYDFRDPRRGEIVVFKGPAGWPKEQTSATSGNSVLHFFRDIGSAVGLAPSSSDNDIIKRVIGVGGDTITCVNDVLTVNSHPLDEPYLYPGSHPCSANFPIHPVIVPKGQLFVMGDHRDDSSDSRVSGTVPVSAVVGRAFVVIWPISDWRTLGVPSTFHQPGIAAAGALAASGAFLVPTRRRRRRGRAKRSEGA